jgi:VCBS repeat-containing protein
MDIGLYKYSAKPNVILVSSTNVTCKTATNGSFTISANGGTAPYTYRVNNSSYTTTTTYNNLAPSTYTVTVKDSKGLLSTLNVTIKSSSVTCP